MSSLWLAAGLLVSSVAGMQPDAVAPYAAPIRPLPWSQLNILHTTDIHGWLGGHLQEPSFSGDWGDYHSFAHHLREKADAEGVDLLLVDTGDRVEGNGLYDGSRPKGDLYFDILTKQNIDLICSGNHELYLANSSNNELFKTVPAYKNNYLASNLDIYNPDTDKWQPLASRFKKFTTKNQGIRVLAFGFIFDFDRNANNTRVQPVEDTVKEKWFIEAIQDKKIDLIIVYGHVALRSQEFEVIFKAIRGEQWDRPIAFLGGHAHLRDTRVFDKKALALASGRYMETVGFMGINGISTGKSPNNASSLSTVASPNFARRYIDNNLVSYYAHTGLNETTFPTKLGRNITDMIAATRKQLKLDHRRGCAPQTYWVNRVPYPDPNSMFTLLADHILPDQLSKEPRVIAGRKAVAMTNTGAIRFDIFKGAFTKDTEFLISPFLSGFKYLSDVPFGVAAKVLQFLNSGGRLFEAASAGNSSLQSWRLPPIEQTGRRLVLQEHAEYMEEILPAHEHSLHRDTQQHPLKSGSKGPPLYPGYTTIDDLGRDGDDTIHSQISFHDVPNAIQAPIAFQLGPDTDEPEQVDLVYNEFMEPYVLQALELLGEKRSATESGFYVEGKPMTVLIREWVQANWAVEDGKPCP